MDDNRFRNFHEHFKSYKETQSKQRARGLNDYNALTVLLDESDEVRLHSRFIASLLDKNENHYQESLFLDKFLECYKPKEFNFSVNSYRCFREYNNIDIYLTDGVNHIIIENKIYAGDQDQQISRYIDLVVKENQQSISFGQIWVIYLTIDREQPSEQSLGDYNFYSNQLKSKSGDFWVHYSNVHYNSDKSNPISQWLEKSLQEVENLSNLRFAINSYYDAVKKLTGKYRSKVMTLNNYLNNITDEDKHQFLKVLIESQKEFDTLKNDIMQYFLRNFMMM